MDYCNGIQGFINFAISILKIFTETVLDIHVNFKTFFFLVEILIVPIHIQIKCQHILMESLTNRKVEQQKALQLQ